MISVFFFFLLQTPLRSDILLSLWLWTAAVSSPLPLLTGALSEFVEEYVRFLLVDSIAKQFDAFMAGFRLVCNSPAFALFRPEVPTSAFPSSFLYTPYNLHACAAHARVLGACHLGNRAGTGTGSLRISSLGLRGPGEGTLPPLPSLRLHVSPNRLQVTEYDGGYSKDHPVIKWFWEVVHSFSEADKRKFLAFCSGSDRAPVGGLGKLNFSISKHGDDSNRYEYALYTMEE